jgi:hypothetical protein
VGPLLAQKPGKTKREETVASIVHSDTLTAGIEESLLVSAYDIKHRLLTDSGAFRRGFAKSRYAKPNLLIIDSGWYEKKVGPSGGQFVHEGGAPLEWEEPDYVATIDALDMKVRAVVVSWDHEGTYSEQMSRAQDFFGARRRFASTILLKPPGQSLFHNFLALSDAEAADLRAFDVVGVTEKELGDTVLDRLVTLAELRAKLNGAGVEAPIQVFGGLDPLYTPLYFAAGAEMFDGLGWLRYAYREGMAYYRDASPLLDLQVSKRWSQAVTRTQLANLDEMAQLTDELKMFAHSGGDWSRLRLGERLKPVHDRLEPRLERSRG